MQSAPRNTNRTELSIDDTAMSMILFTMQPKYILPSKDPLETMFSIGYQKLPLKHDMTGSSNNVLENCFFFNSKHCKKSNNEASEQPPNQPSDGGLSKTLHTLNHIRQKKTDKISKSVELSNSFFNNNLIAMF